MVLHNFLRRLDTKVQEKSRYVTRSMVDSESDSGLVQRGEWRAEETSSSLIAEIGESSQAEYGAAVRNRLADYFISTEGSSHTPWQWDVVKRGSVYVD